jgi:hypothetical protein
LATGVNLGQEEIARSFERLARPLVPASPSKDATRTWSRSENNVFTLLAALPHYS